MSQQFIIDTKKKCHGLLLVFQKSFKTPKKVFGAFFGKCLSIRFAHIKFANFSIGTWTWLLGLGPNRANIPRYLKALSKQAYGISTGIT